MGVNVKIVKCAISDNAWTQSETDDNLGLSRGPRNSICRLLFGSGQLSSVCAYLVHFAKNLMFRFQKATFFIQFPTNLTEIRGKFGENTFSTGYYFFLAFCQIVKVHGTLKITPATLPISIKLCWFHLANGQAERPGPASCSSYGPKKCIEWPQNDLDMLKVKRVLSTAYISEAQSFDCFTQRWAVFD